MRYLAFDLEIAKPVYDIADWKSLRPLGISCAAAAYFDTATQSANTMVWANIPQLLPEDCRGIVDTLWVFNQELGYDIVTWNGLSFDFDILAEESGLYDLCRMLAMGHTDMMFHFFCDNGHPVSLDKAAKGMKLGGKTEGVTGASTPDLWAKGEHAKVLQYVRRDAILTLQLAQAVAEQQSLNWLTSKGDIKCWSVDKLLPVNQAKNLPENYPAWIKDPWPRSKFYDWTEKA
jgi:hypothetical protein